MSATTDNILEQLKTLSLLEASELVKQIEEAFGVSAAASAGVVMAAAPAAAAEAAEEKTEFDVIRASAPANKKAPPKAGPEPERFWESVLVSTPEVVSRTPHTHRPYDERKRGHKGGSAAV